jgi:S-adenosylmethionine:tRNA ribosyltransferase-isomerase
MMRIEDFDYDLPRSLIAQYPSSQRGESRLMVLHRGLGKIEHRTWQDISGYLKPRDLLVVNNTRVLPARLIGTKETGGKVEVLLIPSSNESLCRKSVHGSTGSPQTDTLRINSLAVRPERFEGRMANCDTVSGTGGEWEVLIKGSGRVRQGTRVEFGQGFWGEIKEVDQGRKKKIQFHGNGEVIDLLRKMGHIPLPPYIKRQDEPLDRVRYQTVFAERDGSIAAPTAGLHFTDASLQSIREAGARISAITLHIGIGTFTSVKTMELEDHAMEAEWVEITEETAGEIEKTKEKGGRVIAVGTTTTRALESFSDGDGRIRPGKEMASLFIYPPYRFRLIDGLITNFHLPKSTLIMLVSAFAGKDLIKRAYREAVEKNYRFYSYGDAMLIL